MGDYRKLWTDLGVNLEKHDQLCAVLPELYGSTYLTQENRPEGMNYFNFVVSEVHGLRIQELDEHRKKGGKVVGTFCVFVPEEIIVAAKALSVGLCAGSQFWIEDGEKVLPRNMCPLIKAFMGAKIGGTCPYFQSCDMVIGETTCDGKKKAWEILDEYVPVHVMDLPQMKRDKDFKKWGEEINDLIKKVEEITGNKITVEALKEGIRVTNAKRKALKRLYDLRKYKPSPISGLDCLLITQIAFYDDPKRFTEKVHELCDELEERIKNSQESNKKRILITGTPMALPNWKLHSIIESLDAEVVVEETCTGTRYFEGEVSEEGETLEELIKNLADRYLNINCACFTPNTGRIDDIIKYTKEYEADGVIDTNLSFCHTYAAEHRDVEAKLKEENISIMHIETDYSTEDSGQIKTRVEAFLEMI
ncbi:double-cubane-cluster-containing anaerobic reductase [Clostridium botulinum]|uniref:double-cubane-cluster-containing anaerobic reductase n=1 Tax=Clostridium botulinum TaxID=1491 RepID=UPI00016B9BC1|nr:double-cubane-cluster-containing anaerobic reductase [Clostridium botulinum]APC80404.1 2-hydroxyglutaryl-CoA dehydratase, D-component family protein [Clostridium botulinum]APC84414.1 2-hydroxyglutaryl-CoA dehydratase, D-component family protein [Clostridium botulinum]AXG97052.1 2-hydroxyacyl-CoA dehydratase [Clostridium botulinum]EDT81923.1 putative R-2-hydroxyglutaryl-CoA dehydratase subunit [Clostridium botulinum NCTC 2916]MBY6773491.1 2-hydroxyacyl-CoA dehydratase [Clostridium botulinum]